MNFFKYPIDSSLACGSFSLEHILFIIVCLLMISVGIVISLKKIKDMNKFLFVIGIVVFLFELAKIIWGTCVNRYESIIEYLPLWFCSLFVPSSIFAGITKGKVQKFFLNFMFYGGIFGGFFYLIFPTTSLYKYPTFHFLSFHSMSYHAVMIYVGLMIMIKGLVQPTIKDFIPYFLFTTTFCVISYFINEYFDTNFMFLHSTSNNDILKLLKDLTGWFYPVALTLLQNIGTFFLSYGFFKGCLLIKKKIIK